MGISVTRDVIEALSRSAKAADPLEACGILTGEGDQITGFIPARNVHSTPETHFEIDPQALIDAHRVARAGGPQVMGYFHSHPRGSAAPSATDKQTAALDGSIWAIAAKRELRLFRAGEGGFEWLGTHELGG